MNRNHSLLFYLLISCCTLYVLGTEVENFLPYTLTDRPVICIAFGVVGYNRQ